MCLSLSLETFLSKNKKVLSFIDSIPLELKVGPWSPVAYVVVFGYAAFVIATCKTAFLSRIVIVAPENQFWLQFFRLFWGLYALIFSVLMYQKTGVWPFFSYTVTSWNLMAFRFLTAYFSDLGFKLMTLLADFLKFPALVGCTITVLVWWFVLVPLCAYFLRKKPEDQIGFLYFNFSLPLLNLHLLNLPLSAIEFLWTANSLSFFDLWCGYFIALLYCLFYLNVLDPLGMHFYIIFSPRTYLCAVSFGSIIWAYLLIYQYWNNSLKYLSI